MIELMVVIGIIAILLSVMGPGIADFYRHQHLEAIRGQFGNIFNSARLRAATGWEPAIPLEQTVRDLLEDMRHRVGEE